MKARAIYTAKEIKEEVDRQSKEKYFEIYKEIAPDVATQTLSTVLYVLDKAYGWKKKRLNRFVEDMRDMGAFMEKRFTTVDNYNYIVKHYDIDLVKEFNFEVVDR